MSDRHLAAAFWIAGLVLVVFAYLPGMQAGFYFDDLPNFVEVPALHWEVVSGDGFSALTQSTVMRNRVIPYLTLALNHWLGGLDPQGYHLFNLLVHLLVGAVLVWICYEYSLHAPPRELTRDQAMLAAVPATVLFLVHPLNIQAVTYVVQRMTSLAALFGLLSLGFYLRGRRADSRTRCGLFFSLAVLAWVASLFSKENSVVVPLVVLTYELCFYRQLWRDRLREMISNPRWWWSLVAVSIGFLVVLWVLNVAYVRGADINLFTRYPNRTFSGWERMLTQPRVHLFYLSLLLWPSPSRLNLDHDFSVSRSILEPATTLWALGFWLAVITAVLVLSKKLPRYGFPLLAYLLLHVVESGPLNLELVFEHRMYFPMAALSLLFAVLIADSPGRRRRALLIAVLVVTLFLSVATHRRNLVWADATAFHYDCARKSPEKYRAQYNLGTHLGESGKYLEAIPFLEKAASLDPDNSEPHNQLGATYTRLNLLDKALVQYQEAVRLGPNNAQAHYNLATTLDFRGRYDEAVVLYHRFIEIAPPTLEFYKMRVRQRLEELERQGLVELD